MTPESGENNSQAIFLAHKDGVFVGKKVFSDTSFTLTPTSISDFTILLIPETANAFGVEFVTWITTPQALTTAFTIKFNFDYYISGLDLDTTQNVKIYIFKVKRKATSNKKRYSPSTVNYEFLETHGEKADAAEYIVLQEEAIFNYSKSSYINIELLNMVETIEAGSYFRIEIHQLRNPDYFSSDSIQIDFYEGEEY